jgi:hypothetical protein
MKPPQQLISLDRIGMKSLQGLVPLELIDERPVHGFDALGLLAEQEEVHCAGKSTKCYLLGRIILANRCHVQVVADQDTSETEALSQPPVADFM